MEFHLLCFLIVIFSHLPIQSLVDAKMHGFSVDLIHSDSQLSPFYNKSATLEELSRNDALRSIARVQHFLPSSADESKIESPLIPDGGGYLMKLSFGSPPIERYAIADTGSDLVWIQCTPCDNCYRQDSPLFDPTMSSTYKDLPCDSQPCQALQRKTCGNTANECLYQYRYGSGYTNGVLATDTFTFDSSTAFPNSVFGCGRNNAGTFTSRGAGLVGLGGGPLSLISQLGSVIQQKFAYCLLPRTINSASKLRFGNDAVISGGGVVSTPLLPSPDSDPTFYYLNLEGASVGDKKIAFNPMGPAGTGNIIIDSGTTLNLLETNFYDQLEALVKEAIGLNPLQNPPGRYKLCYDTNSLSNVPEIIMVFHFTGGADVTLKKLNIFIGGGSITCFSMLPSSDVSIYGNIAQLNFQVEYDLANKQLSFAPADCTNY